MRSKRGQILKDKAELGGVKFSFYEATASEFVTRPGSSPTPPLELKCEIILSRCELEDYC